MDTSNDYADTIMNLISTDRNRGVVLVDAEHLPVFYLAKVGVPEGLRATVAEEVARRLRDADS